MNSNQFLFVALHIMRKSSTWLARAHATSASAPRTTQAHAPLRFGHLRSDAQRLRAVLCCDATLVSPLTRTGQPQPCTADVDGAALRTAERGKAATYPEFQGSSCLAANAGGRFNGDAQRLVRDLVRLRSYTAALRLQAGRVAGGAGCRLQCSKRLPALPSRV